MKFHVAVDIEIIEDPTMDVSALMDELLTATPAELNVGTLSFAAEVRQVTKTG